MQPKYYLIIDFEATCCDQKTIPRNQMEIIEFGVVMVNAINFNIVGEFQCFVRPIRHPVLTSFCTQLTSIKQSDVDKALTFPDSIQLFKHWLSSYSLYIFCSWGDYDLNQLQQDCSYHHVTYPIASGHINIKKKFSEKQNLAKKLGLGRALEYAGLKFNGIAHRGIDDARNMARLLPYIFGDQTINAK